MCLSVLAYQEVARRIEELTGAIYALDPYFVMGAADEHAATLSMLAASAAHARSSRRARSPERRAARLLPPAAARARSPCWAPGGVTYAEIVKGSGSRSSSRGERLEPTRATPSPPSAPSPPAPEDAVEVRVEPCVPSERRDDDSVSRSDTRVCESISVSEPYGGDVNVYYDDFVPHSEPELVPEYYAEPPVEYREMPIDVPAPVYRESPEPTRKLPDQEMREVEPVELERLPSPIPKQHLQDLSYAEILALGLRKHPRTQNVTSLPKPQVAHVELVKEIVVECVERSPPIQQFESKVERIDPPRFKPERPERPDKPKLEKSERPERPPPRSRSREIPRQRRGPEKRPTKAHDVQAMKKKKTMKKVIEVQDFDETEPSVQVELTPTRDTSVKAVAEKPTVETVSNEVTKKLQHSATVVETVTELVTEDSQPETTVDEAEHKKTKKKHKSKKSKSSEDEIQKALKEIEELEKNKKKKTKESRDKSKDSITEVITAEIPKEMEITETKKPTKETDAQTKSKKKKGHKESPVKESYVNTELGTVQSSASTDVTTKETRPKKKKSHKQTSLDKLEKSELSSGDSTTDIISVETCVAQKLIGDSDSQIIVETKSKVTPERGSKIVAEHLNQSVDKQQATSVEQAKEKDAKILGNIPKEITTEFTSIVTSDVTHHTQLEVQECKTITKTTSLETTCEELIDKEPKTLLADTVTETSSQLAFEGKQDEPQQQTHRNIEFGNIVTDTFSTVTENINVEKEIVLEKQDIEQAIEGKEFELFSVEDKISKQEKQIEIEEVNKKCSKIKKKTIKDKSKPEVDISSEFIASESEQEKSVHIQLGGVDPEYIQPEIIKVEKVQLEQAQLRPVQLKQEQPDLVLTEPALLKPAQTEPVESETLQLEHVELKGEQKKQVPLEPLQRLQLEPTLQDTRSIEQLPLKSEQFSQVQPEIAKLESEQSDKIPVDPVKSFETVTLDETSSKNKKKRKQKKHDKMPESVVFEVAETVEAIEEDVRTLDPVVKEIPNVVERVEEPNPLKKKKSKKSKPEHVKEDTVNITILEQQETVLVTEVPDNGSQNKEEIKPQVDSKRSKKKSKSKQDDILIDVPVESAIYLPETAPMKETNTEEPIFEEVKSHKKKRSKKQKIDDDDIEKALKEIERSEGTKRKPKEKTFKPKSKQEQPKSAFDTKLSGDKMHVEFDSKKIDHHSSSPEGDIENIQPIEHIDWNAMLEEEEGVTETTFEPVSKPGSDLTITETAYVANQVTILQETTNLFLEKERTATDKKSESSIEEVILPDKSTKSESESVREEKNVCVRDKKQMTPVTSPANEQNNNDKFFSPDALKEGSYNIVEEVTCYEPISQDIETRTIYLITHEEKKLPPIRTVKVFSSKSNSLEEPQSIEDNVEISEQTKSNKITDDKSSISVSDNVLDNKLITDTFVNQEILDSVRNIVGTEVVEHDDSKLEYESKQLDVETSDIVNENVVTTVTTESSKLVTTQSMKNVTEQITKESDEKCFGLEVTENNEVPENQLTPSVPIDKEEKEKQSLHPDSIIVIESVSEPQEPSKIPSNITEKPLTEEDFSDVLEEAIFGSVQDRNRLPAEKKTKEKYSNIPYQALVNEVKSYSVDLDTYQLDYDYTQLILNQRESKTTQKSDDIIKYEDSESVDTQKPPEFIEIVPKRVCSEDEEKDTDVLLTKQIENPTLVSKTVAVTEASQNKTQDLLLQTLTTTETQNKTDVDQVDASPINNQTITIDTETINVVKYPELVLQKQQMKPAINEERADAPIPLLESFIHEENPRISYHEIKDAEMILASQVSNKPAVLTSIANTETVSSTRVSETVHDTESTVSHTSIKSQPICAEHEVPIIKNIDRASPIKEELPRISYHEIKDAEIILASQVKPVEEPKNIKIQPEESQVTEASQIQEPEPIELFKIEKNLITEDNLLKILDKSIKTTVKPVVDHTVDFINTESCELKIVDERMALTATEEEPVHITTTKPSEVIKEPNINIELLREETPRHSYHEIVDAENRLALTIKTKKPDIVESVTEDKVSTIKQTENTIQQKPQDIHPELSKIQLSDTKVETTTMTVTEGVTKTVPEENIMSVPCENKVQELVSVNSTKEPKPLIFETPRVSYREISDAERLLATIITTSRETSREPSILKEEVPTTCLEPVVVTEKRTENHVTHNETSVTNREIEPLVTENVPQVVHQPSQQTMYEVPRYSYHELNDAESLFASMRVSVPEPEVPVEELVENIVTEHVAETISTDIVEKVKEKETCVSKDVKDESPLKEPAFEPLPHSYHEIQDAESVLASMKINKLEMAENIKEQPQEVKEVDSSLSERMPQHISEKVEERLHPTVTDKQSLLTKTDTEHTIDFINNESLVTELVQNVQSAKDIPSSLQKALLEKIELSFEVDDLSNTPVSVVYGNVEDGTPTTPKFDTQDFVNVEKSETVEKTDNDKVDEIPKEPVSIEEDTFEMIEHSEVTDIVDDVNDIKPTESEQQIENEELFAPESIVEISSATTAISSLPLRSITPETSDDSTVVKDLIEEALQESDSPIVTKTKPAYETFVIDDLNESLVPVVFGDIKDIENSIKYKKQELLLQTEKPRPIEPQSLEKEVVDEVFIVERAPSPLADIEIVEATNDFAIPQPSGYVELGSAGNLGLDATSNTISAAFIQTEILQSVLNTPKSEITKQPDTTTNLSTENLVSTDIRETEPTKTETVGRVEKSPIHSLHDLLPEIDSIPEFKPSYSNTVLYSKLSADAPEFTPSYMYQTITTMSESRTEVVDDALAPITMKEETIKVLAEGTPAVPQISYSSVLQTKKEKQESVQNISPPEEKIATEAETTSEEVLEEHIETKSKKSKKNKKKDKDNKKETQITKPPENIPTPLPPTQLVPEVTPILPEPVNVWVKAAEEGKSYADVLAEGLVHEQKECILLVTDKPKEREITQTKTEKSQEIEKVVKSSVVQPVQENKDIVETSVTVSETDNNIGSWAKIVAKRSSPERKDVEILHVEPAQISSGKAHPPMILVDADNDQHKPEIEVDAEGFITIDRSRRSRSKSRDTRSRSNVSQKQETREKSENRFEALTTTLKLDDVESTQSPSDDEKEIKKQSRKSRSSKSKEKEVKPSKHEGAPSTSDEDKQPSKKDKRKRSSKLKENIIKPVTVKVELPKEVEIQEPLKIEEENEEMIITSLTNSAVQPDLKKKSKKKKKDKKPMELIETIDTSLSINVTSSEQETVTVPTVTENVEQNKFDTPVSTPESLQTPIKDRVFSEAQFWKMNPSSLDLSEIISVEIQHTPTEKFKIEIKDQNIPSEDAILQTADLPKNIESMQSVTQFIKEEISVLETQRQEFEDKIAEDQSLESKMADLQREIEEMLLPENDSSLMSDDSPKELTDTQTSIEYQYDELLDNMSPSLATPEPDGLEPKSVEDPVPEGLTDDYILKRDEELDDKHISMSMIDSLLEDTEPISLTETHSLEHTDLLVTQEEDITPRDLVKLDTQEITNIIEPEKPLVVSKEVLDALIKESVKETTVVTKTEEVQDKPSPKSVLDKDNTSVILEKPELKAKTEDKIGTKVTELIESEKNQDNPVHMIDITEINQEHNIILKDSLATEITKLIQTEKSQDDSVLLPEKEIKLLSVQENIKDDLKDTVDNINITERKVSEPDIVSDVPLSNIDTTTNNLTNLKADTFWTDKHNVDDAELLLVERKSVEKAITSVIDEPPIDEGVSVEENIINDNSFWFEKHLYHDAECKYFLLLASKTKKPTVDTTAIEIKDQNDKDRDQGGSSGHSSVGEEPKDPSGSPCDPDYISMDLPGGICSWKDKSSYLSVETPVVDVLNEPVSREDILTTLPIAPAPSSSTQEPEETPQRTAKVTDPQSYCTIFKYIFYVWHDIITKFLISQIAKLCIVMCLATPQLVL